MVHTFTLLLLQLHELFCLYYYVCAVALHSLSVSLLPIASPLRLVSDQPSSVQGETGITGPEGKEW